MFLWFDRPIARSLQRREWRINCFRSGGITRMGYSIIVLVASVALVVYFVFATDASFISKTVVAGLFVFGSACFLWIRGWSLIGVFLLLGLSLFIALYHAWQQARWSSK
jgi:hypothetical protein